MEASASSLALLAKYATNQSLEYDNTGVENIFSTAEGPMVTLEPNDVSIRNPLR